MKNLLLFTILLFSLPTMAQEQFPKIAGHMGIAHSIITVSDGITTGNFGNSYSVGFPVALNIWKTEKVGFSLEVIPAIRSENGSHKMNNVTFHPGILYRLGKGYTFAGRAAFETSGRYGMTPVLNRVLKKNKFSSYYLAIPIPIRFGNDRPVSANLTVQLGIAF
ncbi:hypothetical protein [Aquirufa ecclesiirivi]|uniref:Outer membrane protein beta-barrel domain-containing protein n=2 Tax=Aquirufa ecclesiirivi TaxID=2715124 RepID=A0ABT4JGI3_9BACT|nr:hypothetical protein [Aquirufa ecclesiirivi]MCZ2473264.1 hypothetical protein [Aquirufa ecclesiirivi]MCZ2475043.1 hypothetical protein [Aquirufa ecclesiirivi]